MERGAAKAHRNQRMDLYKGAAIYGVIFIHVLFPGAFGSGVRAAARFAVPFFFLTAGYFSLNASPRALARRAIRTLKQQLLACVPYVLLGWALVVRQGGSVWAWVKSLFTWTALKELLAFHTVPLTYAWQLWFLGALFTVYLWWWVLSGLCRRLGRPMPYDALAALAAALLLLHLLLGEGAALTGAELDNRVLRNALLDGLPFFALGCWCAFRRGRIKTLAAPWRLLILAGLVLSLVEAALFGRQELYFGTLVLLCGLMGRSVGDRRAPEGRLSAALQFCGRELTLPIYVLHMLVLALIREVPALAWLNQLTWLLPLVVAALSTLAALGLMRLQNLRKRRN